MIKRLIDFIKDDPVYFLIILGVIALVIAIGLPVLIFFTRLLWGAALNPILSLIQYKLF